MRRDRVDVEQLAGGRIRAGRDAGEHRGCAQLGAHDVRGVVGRRSSSPGATSSRMPSWLASEPVGGEHTGLVAEQRGDPLLERVDGRVLAIDVVADIGARPSPPASPSSAG